MARSDPYDELPRSAAGRYNPWLIAIIVSIATFMEVLDTTIANVALTDIAGALSAGQDESTYVITSYLVSNAIVLPISGWLSEVIGRKRFYMLSVGLFTASSIGCASSTSLTMMLVFRVLQGIGGGGLAPVEQGIFADTFTTKTRPFAFGIYGITVVTAPALGPVIGGWLTSSYSWHWVFLINVPIGAASLALTGWFVSDSPRLRQDRATLLARGLRVDFVGFALVAIGLGALQILLDKYDRADGFSSDIVIELSLLAGVALIALVLWELRQDHPIVNLRLFAIPAFAVSNVMLFVVGFLINSTTQLLPQLTQTLLSYDASESGLALAVGGLVTLLVMPFAAVLTNVVQPKWLVLFAMVGTAWGLSTATKLDLSVSFQDIAIARTLQIVWQPFVIVPITSIQFVGIPPAQNGNASAIVNMMRNLGGSFGVSIAATLLDHDTQRNHAVLAQHVTAYDGYGAGRALQAISNQVQSQASMIGYLEVFAALGALSLVVAPLCFLLPRLPKGVRSSGH